MQRLASGPFTAPLLREDALAYQELQVLLPAFVRDFRATTETTLPVPVPGAGAEEERGREVPAEMETRLKRLYRNLALKYHPDRNPDDPEAPERFLALTRAYKALVGDTAGPEEGDKDARDPFLDAMSSNVRPKFKHRWRQEGKYGFRLNKVQEAAMAEHERQDASSSGPAEGEEDPWDFLAPEDEGKDEDGEEHEDFQVKLEIDTNWAEPQASPDEAGPHGVRLLAGEETQPDVTEMDSSTADVTLNGDPVNMPSLPPPDVIVVTQPRARKKGVGTPSHFRNWLRSTAVRTIVYVSTDSEAFRADLVALKGLGYKLSQLQPFDPEPHRRALLLVARCGCAEAGSRHGRLATFARSMWSERQHTG
ncbi:unnamed protein product [Prorocentrum cordatum]|uniref:J domain-containing protein n=1 Tax=Prorocentrum cordatum TaxID=2364126 RepID=A0ABN9WIE9_9DINO|nr:unnamed protein product [Polarella glacialis]